MIRSVALVELVVVLHNLLLNKDYLEQVEDWLAFLVQQVLLSPLKGRPMSHWSFSLLDSCPFPPSFQIKTTTK